MLGAQRSIEGRKLIWLEWDQAIFPAYLWWTPDPAGISVAPAPPHTHISTYNYRESQSQNISRTYNAQPSSSHTVIQGENLLRNAESQGDNGRGVLGGPWRQCSFCELQEVEVVAGWCSQRRRFPWWIRSSGTPDICFHNRRRAAEV